MFQAFLIIYLFLMAFVNCENIYLQQYFYDINALMAFFSLAFLYGAYNLSKKEENENLKVSLLPIILLLFLIFSASSFYFSFNADVSRYPALKILSALFLTMALIYYLKDIKKFFISYFYISGNPCWFWNSATVYPRSVISF